MSVGFAQNFLLGTFCGGGGFVLIFRLVRVDEIQPEDLLYVNLRGLEGGLKLL